MNSRDSVFYIVARIRAGKPRNRGSIPGRGKGFSFSKSSRLSPGLPQPTVQWVPDIISPGVKWSGPSSAEVKMSGSVPPLRFTPSWDEQGELYFTFIHYDFVSPNSP